MSLVRLLSFIACTMLYVNLGMNGLDTQPTTLVLTIVYIIFVLNIKGFGFNKKLLVLFILSTVALIVHLFRSGELMIFLRVYAYLVSYFVLWHFGRYFFQFRAISHLVILFWLFGLSLQLKSPEIINIIIGESRYYSGASLSSFAPEPVWFGRIMLLCAVMSLLDYLTHRSKRDIFLGIGFVLLSLLSGSFTIYMYILIIILLYFLFERSRYFIIVAPSSVVIFLLLPEWLKVKSVLNDIYYSTDNILVYGGFITRILNVPASIYFGIIESYGLGIGVDGVKRSMEFILLGKSIIKEVPNDNGTMHGGILSLPYYIGVLGLFWGGVFLRDILRSKKSLIIVGATLLLFVEGSLMNPMGPLLLGKISKYVFETKRKEI